MNHPLPVTHSLLGQQDALLFYGAVGMLPHPTIAYINPATLFFSRPGRGGLQWPTIL